MPPVSLLCRGDVDRKFGMFTYQKGGSVIRMMEQMFGLDTLTKVAARQMMMITKEITIPDHYDQLTSRVSPSTWLTVPSSPPPRMTSSSTLRYVGSFQVLQLKTSPQVAAVEDGSWPQASGPQGSLGETMKTWTNQAGLPLVHAR